ncbi:MAG: DUF1028 domain-containing protein [Bacillota bacterium]
MNLVPVVATFSIVGRDPATGEMGIAVQSKFLSVGSVVPWAAASGGAIATQSYANVNFGPTGLELLRQGLSAQEALDRLLAGDPHRELRQVGIVDTEGRAATFTGQDCLPWAGGVTGPNFAAQGNILVSAETVEAMARTFQQTEGDLAHRLTEALDAGQQAGGDSRGRQSAALYVVKEAGGYGGRNDRYIDLRVDDHPEPIAELKRLLALWRLYFEKPAPESLLRLEGALLTEVTESLTRLGYLSEGEPFAAAWRRFVGTENFEERDLREGYIDPAILEWLRQRVAVARG